MFCNFWQPTLTKYLNSDYNWLVAVAVWLTFSLPGPLIPQIMFVKLCRVGGPPMAWSFDGSLESTLIQAVYGHLYIKEVLQILPILHYIFVQPCCKYMQKIFYYFVHLVRSSHTLSMQMNSPDKCDSQNN